MEAFGKFMVVLLGMIITPIVNGFVIAKLWFWFIVPTFEQNPLRLVEAIGLALFCNFMLARYEKTDPSDNYWEQYFTRMFFILSIAGFALLTGWIVQSFM